MLCIQWDILHHLTHVFLSKDHEQGFILGSAKCLERLDFCGQIPAVQAGKYFYTPDSQYANTIIKDWAELNICFCGFVHSHLVNKNDLSDSDIEFAKQLFKSYNIPILWFGIGIVYKDAVNFQFYSVSSSDGDIVISPIKVEIIE